VQAQSEEPSRPDTTPSVGVVLTGNAASDAGSSDVTAPPATGRAARILVYLPSWLGDTIMATPTLRLLRSACPRSVIVALGRPGMDDLLAGSDCVDDVIIGDGRSLMGPAKLAGRLKPMRIDAALLLPNSFASAMTVRLAGIPRRVGYDRDGRGLLLTESLSAPKRTQPQWASAGWMPISAVEYYLRGARALLSLLRREGFPIADLPEGWDVEGSRAAPAMELPLTDAQDRHAAQVLQAGGIAPGQRFALLNPGGNNPDKRWPVERFAGVAHHVINTHGLSVAINGAPSESELVSLIRTSIALNHPDDESRVACLSELGGTIGSLKGIVRRSALMVTNDTGPRHMAAAFGTPCVTLFGPTDPRWTTLPDAGSGREAVLVADPTLPASEVADDHPQRCRIDAISTQSVIAAADRVLTGR
jgi:heptosyltransferase-2